MPDYMSTKDWRRLLDEKEHKSVKKTGVSDTLDEFAAAKKKDDLPRMVIALQAIISKAGEVKTAQKKYDKIVDFLDKTISAARGELQVLAPRVEKRGEEADDEGDDSTLGKALTKVRQITDPEKAWNFVLVPGKPSAGFVVVKKNPKKSDLDKAFEMRGKRGPFFQGKIYFEAGRFILETPEQPVPGCAKAAKNAASLHAEMNIKVTMRGGGVSLDDDADIEPQDEGGQPQPKTQDKGLRASGYEDAIGKFEDPVDKMVNSPSVRVDGAIDGLMARLNQLRGTIEKDEDLEEEDTTRLLGQIDDLKKQLVEANAGPKVSPKAKYPDRDYWLKLAETIKRLDPSKHTEGWNRFTSRYDEVLKQWTDDGDLVGTDREDVLGTLKYALSLAEKRLDQQLKMEESKDEKTDPKVTQRFLALERKYDLLLRTPGLDPQQLEIVKKAFVTLRGEYQKGNVKPESQNLAKLEQGMEGVLKRALALREQTSKLQGQTQVHQTLKPSMELVKRAAFPSTLIKDPTTIREAVKKDKDLLALIQAGAEATKKQDGPSFVTLEKAARTMLAAVEQRAKANAPLPSDAEAQRIATEALKRVQLGKMAVQYANLGDPPWDEQKSELALEIQSQLFFVESGISKGEVNYQAPSTAGQGGGASGSWWIERGEVNRGDPKAPKTSKKYIFKPGKKEAPVMTGLPPGSGAPREVLAKKFSDMMSGAGFDVGVTPTTLATIDSSQLGGEVDPKGGPLVGSIQQLAPSGGGIAERMKKDGEFAKTIDKRNFDDVAVFDMIFGNLDRHGANLLIDEDKETGKTKLIPIDHGSSLPDPEDLFANRGSLMPSFNIMANNEIPQGKQPLGDETLEALNRLDPDKMVEDMKRQRDDLANRHPDTKDMVSDAAIEGMAARVRFMKIVGNSVPVQVLFVMLAEGARDIAKCDPDDMPELAKALQKQAERMLEGQKDLATLNEGLKSISNSTDGVLITQLNELGWGWNLSMKELGAWTESNPELVSRIISCHLENPDLADERDRLLKEAQKYDTDKFKIANAIKDRSISVQMVELFRAANPEIYARPNNDTDTETLRDEYTKLGGDGAVAQALTAFPAESFNARSLDPGQDPEDLRFALMDRVCLLRRWAGFNKAGGVKAVLDLGGSIMREVEIGAMIEWLHEFRSRAEATKNVLEMDPSDVKEAQEKAYEERKSAYERDIDKVIDQRLATGYRKWASDAEGMWDDGKVTPAVAVMSDAARGAAGQLRAQVDFAKGLREVWTTFEKRFDEAGGTVKETFDPHRVRLFNAIEDAAVRYDVSKGEKTKNELKSLYEEATLGAESKIAKARVAYQTALQALTPHQGTPWIGGLQEGVDRIKTCIDEFDFGTSLEAAISSAGDRVKLSVVLKDALGDKKIGDLPQEGQVIVQWWIDNMKSSTDMYRAKENAKKITELLTANVK